MSAIISDCRLYRYRLERDEGLFAAGSTAIIMVNPSTADASNDDATIRKLRGFAARNGWGRIIVGNLFAFRATDVRELSRTDDPIGPANDRHLAGIAVDADRVIYAWGPMAKQPKALRKRWVAVDAMFRAFHHQPLSIGGPARDGHPKHPLMLPYDSPIIPWKGPAHD